jgi:hypothetical protein
VVHLLHNWLAATKNWKKQVLVQSDEQYAMCHQLCVSCYLCLFATSMDRGSLLFVDEASPRKQKHFLLVLNVAAAYRRFPRNMTNTRLSTRSATVLVSSKPSPKTNNSIAKSS